MGVFNDSICNCCVCPMQSVLKQFEGQSLIGLATTNNTFFDLVNGIQVVSVDEFVVSTSIGDFPICQFSGFVYDSVAVPIEIKLQPIKKNKGECACCEDPITNVLKSFEGEVAFVEGITGGGAFQPAGDTLIEQVGEGIFTIRSIDPLFPTILGAGSSCVITRVGPPMGSNLNQSTFFWSLNKN
ncbi:hypothetical protein [Chengkuizengella axinellae]|uniref:DUF4280 domain-containing protein n=1 Tax=Chengkuizengella axinellae TaxID=3064388 RepID=A0ABT9ITH3_9BACL|nr:hypothetical protein [Chengkuizengella sp. 2205SS18-9]MDP5272650.1 hypothetical protein [Chengkuizengella sp. 2205SS18-9]